MGISLGERPFKVYEEKEIFHFYQQKNSNRAVMAVILGIISLASLGTAVFLAFRNEGETAFRYGVAGLLSVIYALAGLIMGAATVTKPDYYKLFPVLAILLNGAALAVAGLILYMGVYS